MKVKSRSADLKKISDMLRDNPHIISILKTEAGLHWLRNKEYRKKHMQAGRQTIGEQKQSEKITGNAIDDIVGNMVEIPGGTFTMGDADFRPPHEVTLSSFKIGAMPITQRQYKEIMGTNPSNFTGDEDRPVEMVSWEDACNFCKNLSQLRGEEYRLPTEAEWEYACRAGSTGAYCFGDDQDMLKEYAWYSENSEGSTHPVAKKNPNKYGLYDMHGNVWEWCSDWYGDYPTGPENNPTGPGTGSNRVLRGGSWIDGPRFCRCACRSRSEPGSRHDIVGFRVVSSRSHR